jgi:group II intron reverse transcriptase/maturase
MRSADAIIDIHQKRGAAGLPLERVYKHLFNPELFLRAYGKIYRNVGAMTKGSTEETVDGMSLQKIHSIIGLLQVERYQWTPVRRTHIPKANGKLRPLGIPTWGDKLVQEVLRSLLEPYYEQRFSDHSHGFRPQRSCHSALNEIQKTWKGTVWFIEGDIKGCFDNIDHTVLLKIIQRDIQDGRIVRLIEGLLKAGYMEDWRYYDTLSGTPQGGIISPLLANVYLNDLDKFVEDTLIPVYTRGTRRRYNPEYGRLGHRIATARKRGEADTLSQLTQQRRELKSVDPVDPGYRRLRYVRYADDFLLGFVGPKKEAEEIRERLGEWLETNLKLTLSKEKTLVTHAGDEKARFLGYEIKATRGNSLIDNTGKRAANGNIALLMPQKAAHKYRDLYSKGGKILHRAELLAETDYTILQRYQGVLQGVYNFYCMAVNVSRRMSDVKWVLEISLSKTLASKLKIKVNEVYRRYECEILGLKALRAVLQRPDKEPLTAVFGGISFARRPEGLGYIDFRTESAWFAPGDNRSEVVARMLAGKCELCECEGPVQVHHIRKLADIDRPGRRPKEGWERVMSARKRKTLVVCENCHQRIHAGHYDGPRL